MKRFPEICLWTWKSPLYFRSHPDPDQDPGIFSTIFIARHHAMHAESDIVSATPSVRLVRPMPVL